MSFHRVRGRTWPVKPEGRRAENVKSLLYSGASADDILIHYKGLRKPQYLYSPELVNKIVDKLNLYMKYKWFEFNAHCNQNEPDMLKISRFLQEMNDQCGVTHRSKDGNARRKRTYVSDVLLTLTTDQNAGRDRAVKMDVKDASQVTASRSRIDRRDQRADPVDQRTPKKKECSLKIIPVEISGPLGRLETYALLDEGLTTTSSNETPAKNSATGKTRNIAESKVGQTV
ncbi:hypothetical protein EVAR_102256_1, partial [Eumeta japonica]